MANIKLNTLAKPVNIEKKSQFTYADIEVDVKFEQTQQAELYSNLFNKDLRGNYDLGAIKNSIINIFTTFPGQKVLNPEFGLNLNQFLFLPNTVSVAENIGDYIYNQLLKQEPRIKPIKIRVESQPELDQYNITMVLEVPFINNNTTIEFKSILNSTGVTFYN